MSRAGLLAPFLDFLGGLGAPADRGLERHNLPPGVRESPETLVSTHARVAFLGDMARREGIEEFGWQAGFPGGTRQLNPGVARTLERSPTLLQALEAVCTQARREATYVQIWLEYSDDELLCCHRGPSEIGTPGADELALLRTAIILQVIRLYAAPDWAPRECALAIEGDIGPLVREELRDARILRAPDYSWVRLPRSILAVPPRAPAPAEAGPSAEGPEPALGLVGSLVQVLRPYLSEGAPTVRDAAGLAGTSVRSLQRGLTREGSSFSDVLQRARLEVARELLQQPDIRIVDVAHEAGFSDHPHFVRFFQRLGGMTPREYRASLTAG